MSVNWNSDEMRVWEKEATEFQQKYFDSLNGHEWMEYEESNYDSLRRNIGYSAFGVPGENPNESNDLTGYDRKQLSYINKVFDIVMDHKGERNRVCVFFIFVCGKVGDCNLEFPVIGVRNDVSILQYYNIYIDSCARVYRNWQDYLENNKLPECAICYPKNGIYSAKNGVVQVQFGISPAGEASAKFLKDLDSIGALLAVNASRVAVTSLFIPVGLPLLIGQ